MDPQHTGLLSSCLYPGGEPALFPRLPLYPAPAVQAGAGLHHLGLQAHHAQRGRHRAQHPHSAPTGQLLS